MSDAKQSYRQANLTFKVPKLNRGLRPQVLVKKMLLPERKQDESESEEEISNDLIIKKRELFSRFKIYKILFCISIILFKTYIPQEPPKIVTKPSTVVLRPAVNPKRKKKKNQYQNPNPKVNSLTKPI